MAVYPQRRFDSQAYRFDFHSNIGIIETHQHLSEPGLEDRTFGWGNNDIDFILQTMDRCGVTTSILQPLGGAHDPVRVHHLIHRYSQQYPGRIFGIASMNIKEYGEQKTVAEFEYCVRDLGFVGIKFHGFSHGINPSSPLADVYFQTAHRLGVPLMVCVGAHGQPFTNPGMFAEKAMEYPDLKIIFAHLDYSIAETAIAFANRLPNIYLSTSLSIVPYLEKALATVGAGRMTLASEDAASIPAEIAKSVFASHNDAELEQMFRATPIELFGLQDRAAPAPEKQGD